MLKRHQQFFLLFILLLLGCSPQTTGPIGDSYHNVTAHYNAYFMAKEKMIEIENALLDQYQWNYNKILPIYPQYDTTFGTSQRSLLDDCIQKSSLAIQRHPGSKWEDDSYILVGKARLYGSEFPEGIETFKYVNTRSEENVDRHEALALLMRTFIEAGELNNAIAVSDYMKKEDLNTVNRRRLYMTRAYLHQQRKEWDQLVENLVIAEELMNKNNEKARISFIIGQVYQSLGFESQAYKYYKKSLKYQPSYELSFHTKLNMAQVTALSNTSDLKKVEKYFRKLLKDQKNLEYQDRIYYEMGDFELKQGNTQDAIGNYKQSVKASTRNQRQKAYSYLKLAQIYYDSLKQFDLAKVYYDSTIAILPRDEENYKEVKNRQEILTDFVKHLTTIQKNDSLISLTKLSQDSLNALLTKVVLEQKELEDLEKERKRKEAKRASRVQSGPGTFDPETAPTISTSTSGTWYFYNSTAMSQGQSEFTRIWGARALEDDWRRSQKASTSEDIESSASEENTVASTENQETSNLAEEDFDLEGEKKKLQNTLPKSNQEITVLLSEVEEAYYELGNIYNFRLFEKENAILTFETLLRRFDSTQYAAEVLYQLHLLNKGFNDKKSKYAANQLLANYPESIYAKLLVNPLFREENLALNKKMQRFYDSAYQLHKKFQPEYSLALIDSVLSEHPESDHTDSFMLLRAINLGQTEGIHQYQYELNNFINQYPDSELNEYAQKLVKASQDYQINLYSSSRARYKKDFTKTHYFILVYPFDQQLSDQLPDKIEEITINADSTLQSGNLVLSEDYQIILVNEFLNKNTASNFIFGITENLEELEQQYLDKKLYSFVISKDNFEILYETKDLESYLTFYSTNYLR